MVSNSSPSHDADLEEEGSTNEVMPMQEELIYLHLSILISQYSYFEFEDNELVVDHSPHVHTSQNDGVIYGHLMED